LNKNKNMKNIINTIKNTMSLFAMIAIVATSAYGLSSSKIAQAATVWDTNGSYVINFNYLGTDYPHDMSLIQDGMGNLTGTGGSPSGANVYKWVMNSGTVVVDAINFTANYTATEDAVTPQTVLTVIGVIAEDGTMSGTWNDNYQGGERSGTWSSVTGNAVTMVSPVVDGQIGGTVIGGVGAGVLTVTSIETVDSTATADGSFENGWKYVFNITLPTNETHLAMKFDNWTMAGGTIPAANNMRISSSQANNAGATILVLAANTYTIPTLDMVVDLDPTLEGIQVKVTVEVAVPVGTTNGSYTTNYGVKSN
jgi:hypothetical protein